MDNYRGNFRPEDENRQSAEKRSTYYREQNQYYQYQHEPLYEQRSYMEQPGYQQNMYGPANHQTGGLAIAALVFGIVSITLFWFPPISMPASITGIVISVIALSKKQSRGLSIAGMITSIVGGLLAIIAVVFVLLTFSVMDTSESHTSDDDVFFAPYPYAEEQEEEEPLEKFDDFFNNFNIK